ncbi:unnamed protein product [Ectocarpus sp. 12 AP-2014]
MDRRVIFLAEPAPLVGLRFDRRQHDAGDGGSGARTRKASLDLRHLRGVIEELSRFCRQQQAQEHGQGANSSTGSDEGYGGEGGRGIPKAGLPTRPLKAAEGTPLMGPTTAREPERDDAAASGSRSGRRVLLAAVFPCPDVPLEATGEVSTAAAEEPIAASRDDRSEQQRQEREPQRQRRLRESSRLLNLALAFAQALEGCGVWLEPADFETRVLAPTRALIDRQLEDFGGGQPPADVVDATSDTRSSRGSATRAAERPIPPLPPSPLGASTTGPSAEAAVEHADKEAFARSAADEIALLTRQAAVETVTPAAPQPRRRGGESRGTEADGGHGHDGRRLCMLDVLWVAPSFPAEGGGAHDVSANGGEQRQTAPAVTARTARQDSHGVALKAASAPASAEMPPPLPPPLTLSEPVDRPCSGPLRSALLETRAHFPRSRITIFPACVQTPRSGEDDGSSSSSCRDKNGCGTELRRAWQRQWKAWCESTGARVFLGGGVSAAIGAGPVLDAGLLWRGPVVAGATRTMVSAPAPPSATSTTTIAAKVPPRTSSGTSSSAATLHNPNPPQPARAIPVFPSLDGFALRLAAASVAPSASGAVEGVPRGAAAGGGPAATVARGASSTLGRAPSLRLARVISPTEVARACHLLADGDLAPALELFVEDDERCRGSAEFLKRWAVDGRGLLLVTGASAAEATGGVRGGRAEAGKGGVDEGLAMACFPHHRRRNRRRPRELAGSGGNVDVGAVEEDEGRDETAPVWSVTLFRKASEFSEAVVSALVGESGGDRGMDSGLISRLGWGGSGSGSVLTRTTTGPSHTSPPSDPVEEKEDMGETAATSSVVASLPVYTSASLISQQSRLFFPPQEALSAKPDGAMTPLPSTPAGASTSSRSSSRKRRRSAAPTVVGSTIPRGSERRAPGEGALGAEAACSSSSSPREGGGRRRSSRIVGALAVAEANNQLSELQERCAAAAAEGRRRRRTKESASSIARSACGGGNGRGAGCRGYPAEGEQAGVQRGCGGRGRERGPLSGETGVPGGDEGHGPGFFPFSSLAYALYGSFGDWGDGEASAAVDGGSRRRFWAEECLLPYDGGGGGGGRGSSSSSGRAMFPGGSGSRNGNTSAYSKAAPTPTISGAAGVSAGERGEGRSRKHNDGGRGDGENDRSAGGVSGCAAATARASGTTGYKSGSGSSGGGFGVAAAAPPSPPRRTLSTAEQALVNAGQQQRARAKERRVVAREQRARMDRPRPRPRPRVGGGGIGAGGGGSLVSSSSSLSSWATGVVDGGSNGGNFQRSSGPTSVGPSSRSLGMVGRSGSMGSKLSRGSLILGRSVAGGTGVGGSSSVAGAGGGEGSGGAGAGGGAAGGHARVVVVSPAGVGVQQESATAAMTTRRGEKSIASTTVGSGAGRAGRRGNHRERPESFASPSSSPSISPAAVGLAAAAVGGTSRRAKRAILQDPPRATVPPPTTSAEPAERATLGGTKGAGGRSMAAGPGHGAGSEGRSRAGGAGFTGAGAGGTIGLGAGASAGAGDAAVTAGAGDAGFRRVMERAMLAAIASQLGLAEDNPSVLAVFERESRLMGGGGGGGGEVEE